METRPLLAPDLTSVAAHPSAGDASLLRPRLLRAHFALARGWIQGMELRALADRYLPGLDAREDAGRPDLRTVKSVLDFVLDELATAARRFGREGDAVLMRRQAARIRLPDTLPSLEEFASRIEGGEHLSEAELVESYESAFGRVAAGGGPEAARRAQARRARLMTRQLALITFLEGQADAVVTASTAVAECFVPRLAERLQAAGIMTMSQLRSRIAGATGHWHAGIAGIGAVKAGRIERFVRAALSDGSANAVVPDAAPDRFGIVPLERLRVPASLDGSAGSLRAPADRCMISAATDHEAVLAFLQTKASTHTRRAYRKELERFLLWSVVERRRAVSDLSAEDCMAYAAFIADPRPATLWCGPRHRQRFGALWRPFEGPLSPRSQSFALTVVRAFFEWGCRVRYLVASPWDALGRATDALRTESERSASANGLRAADGAANARFRPLERTLTRQQWRFACAHLSTLPDTGRTRRLRLVLALAYSTGLRLAELVRAQVGHLRWLPPDDEDPGGWSLQVLGKGNRLRDVPLWDEVVEALRRSLAERGLPSEIQDVDPATFLIGKADDLHDRMPAIDAMLRARHVRRLRHAAERGHAPPPETADGEPDLALGAADGIKAATLHGELKDFFGQCATALSRAGDTQGGARLARASAHWLRHTHASHAIEAGMPLDVVRDVLGHASLATTSLYVRTEERRRLRESRKLARRAGLP